MLILKGFFKKGKDVVGEVFVADGMGHLVSLVKTNHDC